MSYYASLKNPGEGPVYSYKQVWDADLLYGCNCDSGYFGPDCSLKHCPTGDDPFTGTSIDPKTQQYNEKQQVVCVATAGSFTLSFRGETTAPIPADASAAKVKAALQVRSRFLQTIRCMYGDRPRDNSTFLLRIFTRGRVKTSKPLKWVCWQCERI